MKTIFLPFLAFSAASLSALGDTYRGSITQTVGGTGDLADFYVGETFIGYYEYVAPTVNGVFYHDPALVLGESPSANQTLAGQLYFTVPNIGGFVDLQDTTLWGDLAVSGGSVTSFFWEYEVGFSYEAVAINTEITAFEFLPDYSVITFSRLEFGAPIDISSVPDSGTTVALLGFAIAGLAAARRRFN